MAKSMFITIEGIEGVGKSTALQFIQDYLKKEKKEVIVTREPGGTVIAEHIRKILLTHHDEEIMLPETELLLMFACRAQHIAHVIKPALLAGKWVISDRFVDASFAYQGYGREMDLSRIQILEAWLVQDIYPDLTILLDAPPEIGLERAKHRGFQDRIEREKIDFHTKVRLGYLKRAEEDKKRFRIIDASQPMEIVQNQLKSILQEKMSMCHDIC